MTTIGYDREVDAAYFQIEEATVIESEEIADGVIVDYDENNRIVAVELLGIRTLNLEGLERLKSLIPLFEQAQIQEWVADLASAVPQ
ncbi:MAG: DUF2283 domain-containing protein [Cyanobacteria bacterium RI_101]|nr:DUF2283 domain-containing protein [Cyanobacteria bacterium RI_101]